jgi:hypothetical protein
MEKDGNEAETVVPTGTEHLQAEEKGPSSEEPIRGYYGRSVRSRRASRPSPVGRYAGVALIWLLSLATVLGWLYIVLRGRGS